MSAPLCQKKPKNALHPDPLSSEIYVAVERQYSGINRAADQRGAHALSPLDAQEAKLPLGDLLSPDA